MKTRRIWLAALVLLFLSVRGAAAQDNDLAQKETEQSAVQDSIEASTPILVPFASEIRRAAWKHHLPPALLAAFIQEESGFNPWAGRTEPGYLKKKQILRESRKFSKEHRGLPTPLTEQYGRSTSYGLMQPMGEIAREQGYDSTYLASLYSPFNSIDQGAILLKKNLARYPGDTLSAISAYNQGNNRKRHGMFENARYVYRVATAWHAYDRIFRRHQTEARQHNENRLVKDTTGDSGRGSDISHVQQNGMRTVPFVTQNNGDDNDSHRDGNGPRHDPSTISDRGSGGKSAQWLVTREGLSALAVVCCLLGLAGIMGHLQHRSRQLTGVLRSAERQFPRFPRPGQPSPYSS